MFSLKNMKLLNTNCEAFALDTMKYPRESLLINTVNWECQQSDQKTFPVDEKASLYVSHKQVMWSRSLVICGFILKGAITSQGIPHTIKENFGSIRIQLTKG